MADRAPSAPPDPALFEIAGRAVTTADVLRAADVRGDLEAAWLAFLVGEGAWEHARAHRMEADPGEVERRSDDVRYDRGLLTAEETEDWLDARNLTMDDLEAFVLRSLWRERHPVEVPPAAFATSPPAQKERFRTEVTFSAELDRLAHGLARRMAVVEANPSGDAAAGAEVARSREACVHRLGLLEADLYGWLAAAGLTRDGLDRLLRMDLAFEARRASVLTPKAREGIRQSMRIPLTRVDVETVSVASIDAAREVRCCVVDDGVAMAELAAAHGLAHARRSLVLEDVDPAPRNALISAATNDVLEPVETPSGFEVFRLRGKQEPDASDPEIRRRIDRELLEAHDADLEARHVRWLLRVDDPA